MFDVVPVSYTHLDVYKRQVLENGMVVAGLSSDIMGIVKGVAFLIAVAVAYERKPGQIIT